MGSDYFRALYSRAVEAGDSLDVLWDEQRMPFDSIEKRLTDLLDLRGRKVVITGGGGAGLGQACANRFAGLGADVALVDIKVETTDASGSMPQYSGPDPHGVASRVAEKWGTRAFGVHGDATDWDDVQRWMAECHELLGGIDILVNSAVDVAVVDFSTATRQDLDRSIRGTMAGPMYASRAVLDYMIPQGRGHIINIGSASANMPSAPKNLLYGTGKSWLASFTKFLAAEVIHHGIRVAGVNPASMVRTKEKIPAFNDMWFYSLVRNQLGRYLLHEETANVVAFLASDAASAIVGEVIGTDGGSSL
ncbi:SDR family NAD(P)-dependent oxidoreductase [Streptomyces canus]|uniref:SDR family NAD(P)-dependent oxidoreductase n=1 Tax=Streptomyces canus TaxID=58343 RepID=UPI00036D71CF|nr:SDR family oxidoreductase [Streptomyces canus]